MRITPPSQLDDAARVRVFPPAILLLTVVIGLILNVILPISFSFEVSPSLRYVVGGAVVLGAIGILGVWSIALFRRGGQNENPWEPTPHIETRWPYSVTRNPMYLQLVIICLGVAFAMANWWIVFLTPVCAWALQELAIKPEEKYLENKFGAVYLQYKARVRRWL